jgi:hypothetical protein
MNRPSNADDLVLTPAERDVMEHALGRNYPHKDPDHRNYFAAERDEATFLVWVGLARRGLATEQARVTWNTLSYFRVTDAGKAALDAPVPTPCPLAPAWHVESDACQHGWESLGVTNGSPMGCDCEDPAHPWPARVAGDGPRDCDCSCCSGYTPRWERGKLAHCEYKYHHCGSCHERGLCTAIACQDLPPSNPETS